MDRNDMIRNYEGKMAAVKQKNSKDLLSTQPHLTGRPGASSGSFEAHADVIKFKSMIVMRVVNVS